VQDPGDEDSVVRMCPLCLCHSTYIPRKSLYKAFTGDH